MKGNLYEVKLEYTILVIADCEEAARDEAKYNVEHEECDSADAHRMEKGDSIPTPWVKALPYGSADDDETVGKIMEGL